MVNPDVSYNLRPVFVGYRTAVSRSRAQQTDEEEKSESVRGWSRKCTRWKPELHQRERQARCTAGLTASWQPASVISWVSSSSYATHLTFYTLSLSNLPGKSRSGHFSILTILGTPGPGRNYFKGPLRPEGRLQDTSFWWAQYWPTPRRVVGVGVLPQ